MPEWVDQNYHEGARCVELGGSFLDFASPPNEAPKDFGLSELKPKASGTPSWVSSETPDNLLRFVEFSGST